MAIRQFESLWTIGDKVSVTFPDNGLIKNAQVKKVSFDANNTLYDVEVPFSYYEDQDMLKTGYARLHGIKEWHLRNPELDEPLS